MAYKLPWSNFHELNLDWILEKIKELREDVDNITGSATPYTSTPEMDGVGSPGTEVSYARGDHRHPTDTSRASAADLSQEILDRGAADDTLQANIDATDAKIKFSSSAPYMDSSSASAGFSDYMARADHVHPTDTSRASATDLATLTARVDAFSGSAAPSDATPLMDGVGAAGTGGNYSRGDHVHPSDTSKLDKAGGTITGLLTQSYNEQHITVNAISWLRVLNMPQVNGSKAILTITRKSTLYPDEVHKIEVTVNQGGVVFNAEDSAGSVVYINAIRYTSAGKVDIHMDQTYESDIGVFLTPMTADPDDMDNLHLLPIAAVADAPGGEIVLATHNFQSNNTLQQVSTASLSLYNCSGSISPANVSFGYKKDKSVLQFSISATLTVTARTGENPGFMFDLPFAYNGPTSQIFAGFQSQNAAEALYITLTNGSTEVLCRTTEAAHNLATGTVRFVIPQTILYMN